MSELCCMFFVCIDACLIERFVVCGVLRMCSL